jgi:hypothetical protein
MKWIIFLVALSTGFTTGILAETPSIEWEYFDNELTANFYSSSLDPVNITVTVYEAPGEYVSGSGLGIFFIYVGESPFNLTQILILSEGETFSFDAENIHRETLPSGKRMEMTRFINIKFFSKEGYPTDDILDAQDILMPFLGSNDVIVVLRGLGSEDLYRSMTINELQLIRELFAMYTEIATGSKKLKDYRN